MRMTLVSIIMELNSLPPRKKNIEVNRKICHALPQFFVIISLNLYHDDLKEHVVPVSGRTFHNTISYILLPSPVEAKLKKAA